MAFCFRNGGERRRWRAAAHYQGSGPIRTKARLTRTWRLRLSKSALKSTGAFDGDAPQATAIFGHGFDRNISCSQAVQVHGPFCRSTLPEANINGTSGV